MAEPVYLCAFALLSLVCNSRAVCPEDCSCSLNTIVCNSTWDIPDGPPSHVTNVYFGRVLSTVGMCDGYFSSGNWTHVTSLEMVLMHASFYKDILSNYTSSEPFYPEVKITDGCFSGLEQLQYLGLCVLSEESDSLGTLAFSNLSSLKTINFTNSFYLPVDEAIKAMNPNSKHQNVLPSLENIILDGVYSLGAGFYDADNLFFDGLTRGGRNIKYLDLSNTAIRLFNISEFYRLCHAIESLILLNTIISTIKFVEYDIGTCQSLRTLDISGAYLFNTVMMYNILDCRWMRMVDELENLYINSISEDPVILRKDADLSKCLGRLKIVVAQNNNLSLVNFTIHLNSQTVQNFRELDLSNNVIEYFSPATLSVFTFLQLLNLANNRLHRMQQHYPGEFELLFQGNTELHELNLARNQLTHIPNKIFMRNIKLETIDISNNKLTSILIELSSLVELHFLGLSQNHLKTLGPEFLFQLDHLGNGETSAFRLNLSWNEYICECDDNSQYFVTWLKDSRFLSDTESPGYSCHLDGEIHNIFDDSVSYICRVKAVKRKLVIAAVTVSAIIVLAVIISMTSRRVYLKGLRRRNVLRELENGDFRKQYLVFLSYASEDAAFVYTNIYDQLEAALAKIAPKNRYNVCIGDRDFRVGTHVHTEVVRCMEKSGVVIFVTSGAFCRKDWCLMEVTEAYDQHKPIILLMRERVETRVMPMLLRRIFSRYTHAAWVEDEQGGHIEPRMDILCESIVQLLCDEYDYQQEMDTPV